jgi:hypothetical protein
LELKGYPTRDGPHPFENKCKKCGNTLDQLWRQIDHPKATGWFAVNCCDPCYSSTLVSTEANLDRWFDECPTEFRKDWDNMKGDTWLLRSVLKFNPAHRRGLIIKGESGKAKTRAVWQLLRQLTLDGIDWRFTTALDLMDGISAECSRAKVLVLDDLGNDHLHTQKEISLLRIIRKRCDWHMPTIITTQFSGAALEKRFSEAATAQAIIRRLHESAFFDIISAN